MKKTTALLALLLCFALLLSACAKEENPDASPAGGEGETQAPEENEDFEYSFDAATLLSGKHYVEMAVKDYGTMILEIDADAAPVSATNFLRLVSLGFYDGLTFHRIIAGFMAQGGDGSESELAGEVHTIKGEFLANGYENPISHTRGVISMARAQDFNSASSQFFIMHADYTGLDGGYAAFGRVIDGIGTVDAMCEAADPDAPNGVLREEDRPVIEYAKLLGTRNPLE